MTYLTWGTGFDQYGYLGDGTTPGTYFSRPRSSIVNSAALTTIGITTPTTFVDGGTNTWELVAFGSDRAGNISVEQQDLTLATVTTDFYYFRPMQFASNPADLSVVRESGFIWVDQSGADYSIKFQAATYTPWNIEWNYASNGTQPAPDPINLVGVPITLQGSIQNLADVEFAVHQADGFAGQRDMLVTWGSENAGGVTMDVTARAFNSTGVGLGASFLLFDDRPLTEDFALGTLGSNFAYTEEVSIGGGNKGIHVQEITASGSTAGLFSMTYAPIGISNILNVASRRLSNGNYALTYSAERTIGGNPTVVMRMDVVNTAGTVVSTHETITTNPVGTPFAWSTTGIGPSFVMGFQSSATQYTVIEYDNATGALVNSDSRNGIFGSLIAMSSPNNALAPDTRFGVLSRTSAADNDLHLDVFDARNTALNIVGTASSEIIVGTALDDTLDGGGGEDKLAGGSGSDVVSGGDGRDIVDGWAGNDTLNGGSGNDVIDGGAGNDSMTGGTGNDLFTVDAAGDIVVELSGEGDDEVRTSRASYTLGANLERLSYFWSAGPLLGFTGTGNELNNTIRGGEGGDVLAGQGGADTLIGDFGDDIYYVETVGDTVVEALGAGNDTVFFTGIPGTLAANVENGYSLGTTATLTGNNLDNVLVGGYASVAQTIFGNDGNDYLSGTPVADVIDGGNGTDTLLGRGGADNLNGGAGNDNYYVEHVGTVITEAAGGGGGLTDIVYTNVNITLAANVEYLFTYGAATSEIGNASDNAMLGVYSTTGVSLSGLAGNDTLYGSGAADTLTGGGGNDTFFGSAGGPDGDIDLMDGGTENDTYFVQEALDSVTEGAGAGTDVVYAAINYTLGANLETLFIYGGAATGTGNGDANTLIGSYINTGVTLDGAGGADIIIGGGGNDTLIGGAGIDQLTGATGNDTFTFNVGTAGGDSISDFNGAGPAAGDVIRLLGYGAGATFTNIDATHWQVNYGVGLASHEIITIANGAAIDVSDVVFI